MSPILNDPEPGSTSAPTNTRAPGGTAPGIDAPSQASRAAAACFVALLLLGLAWELWLAPLPGGNGLLALKVLPLALALPAVLAGRRRACQWWSMLILMYVAEGTVRAMSDPWPSSLLGAIEFVLAAAAYMALLLHLRGQRSRRTTA